MVHVEMEDEHFWKLMLVKEKTLLRLYKMRVLKYYVENKAQLETWK